VRHKICQAADKNTGEHALVLHDNAVRAVTCSPRTLFVSHKPQPPLIIHSTVRYSTASPHPHSSSTPLCATPPQAATLFATQCAVTHFHTCTRARTHSLTHTIACVLQPSYTNDPRRDHHHVIDGPVVGNGNIGVVVASGNPDNLGPGPAYVDLFMSTNSFWAVTVRAHTSHTSHTLHASRSQGQPTVSHTPKRT
jgi:hypothetical protein